MAGAWQCCTFSPIMTQGECWLLGLKKQVFVVVAGPPFLGGQGDHCGCLWRFVADSTVELGSPPHMCVGWGRGGRAVQGDASRLVGVVVVARWIDVSSSSSPLVILCD